MHQRYYFIRLQKNESAINNLISYNDRNKNYYLHLVLSYEMYIYLNEEINSNKEPNYKYYLFL